MVAVPYSYTDEYSFKPADDRLPPQNIEAEEAVLGGILLDPSAIYRVKDRLETEHFYIGAHKDIYHACLRLNKQGLPTDLLHVSSWLSDHDLLARIGGRNKLATLIDRTVSAVNIDSHAAIIITKSKRRELLKSGYKTIQLAYDEEQDLIDIYAKVTNRIKAVTDTPLAPTKDEYQRWKHDQLLEEVTSIYTTCVEPSFRFLKLHELAKEHSVTNNFLEHFYLKSLTAQCSKLLTYEELKELAGSTVREWLLNGLVPKSTTILLAADGGVGKTKLAYGIGKVLIQGNQFGNFIATGEKRKILYYQGDESPGDMMQALESLGYSEEDIGKYVRVRFGWSAENIPALIEDLKEFQPDFVVIDSLSTINRFSIYQESQMEYARPILEMTGLATNYKTTFLLIHHSNKLGGVRGTTAIRNAVSEVWTLSKDSSETGTPNDRILEIDKSRSRSSGNKYRMFFNPEDLSFTFMGEEGQDFGGPAQSAKERTLQLLADHRNVKFTSEEIAHRLGFSKDYARRYLTELSADGLVSVKRQPGKANLYFLAYEGSPEDHPSDHLDTHPETFANGDIQPILNVGIKKAGSPQDHPSDHLQKADTVSNTAKGDPESAENREKIQQSENFVAQSHLEDHLCSNALLGIESGGDPGGDPTPDMCEKIHTQEIAVKDLSENNCSHSPQGDPGGDPRLDPSPANPELSPLPLIQEKCKYWSISQNREVEVFHIFDNFSEVSCRIPGRGTVTLPFLDLQSCPESPTYQLSVRDEVVILIGKHKETFATITTITNTGIYLKSDSGKLLGKSYFPHQMVKV
ncbi:DnaB-like helicase N-terminal domain-containing protein [Halotia branconii]|uniref:DnaB-like helicase N-terminal domain-containing protein n=1 Tax=Halotia branconii CENA392 TaxID=1539056 RepID=A0AAJ6NMX4_9CYAN|nr:DnaB-like helicase N-terminal domain-containing protein [Halotia branconii]WGV23464.1 DnaB-like helicase N-terminal domain-containing protein [Halotia branconii CENA392]